MRAAVAKTFVRRVAGCFAVQRCGRAISTGVTQRKFRAPTNARPWSIQTRFASGGYSLDDIGSKDWRARGDLQPAPRKLSEVVKLPLLKLEDAATVRKIWLDHHVGNKEEDVASTSQPVVATTMEDGEYNLLRTRAATCPFFILPVRREGGHFVLLAQWQDNVCLFTFLEEYKQNPHGAEPWAAMTMYNELVPTHRMALSRFDYNPLKMSKVEAKRLMELIRVYYVQGNQYQMVEDFNHRPDHFDFERHLRECE